MRGPSVPLLKRSGGSIVVVASLSGTRILPNTGAAAYSVPKAGQFAFSRVVALELAPPKTRIGTVRPAAIRTRIDVHTTQRDRTEVFIDGAQSLLQD